MLPFWEGVWEDFKYKLTPLTSRWFWYYVFPAVLIVSMVVAYYNKR